MSLLDASSLLMLALVTVIIAVAGIVMMRILKRTLDAVATPDDVGSTDPIVPHTSWSD